MRITVLLFATLKDIVGESKMSLAISSDTTTVDSIRETLYTRYPELEATIKAAIASVNREYAFAGDVVKDGDEVAFFPPVSGGSGEPTSQYPEIYMLPNEAINHDEIISAVTTPATGAVCLFSGMVRGETQKDGHLPQTEQLEYEAYEPMALEKMKQVAAEIREKFPLVQGIAIAQRIGKLKVGENTVLIACSSGHRDQGCFEAARYGIDRLKEIVPVWKKEISPDGSTWIEGDYTPTMADRAE
jgi:molybdopterin synthase catalytic subunit